MKWVVKQNQFVAIRGLISGTDSEEDGTYTGESKQITRRWLEFEHTDGLNWFNIAARKHQRLFYWRWVQLTAYEGAAVGGLLPRTDATLFGRERHDHYRLAGYALGGSLGLNLTVWDHIFVQTELKGGFAHIVSGRTTPDPADKVSHHMLFGQAVLVFGGRWNFR